VRIRVAARIQAPPSRRHLRERISLGFPTEVVEHQSVPPNPWQGYQQCLTDLPDCTHLLVVQDDCVPASNATAAVEQIAADNPDVPTVLFFPKVTIRTSKWVRHAMVNDKPFTEMHRSDFLPCVAVVWPKAKAEEFLYWATEVMVKPRRPDRADDGVAGRWMRATRQKVMVACPSVFEHPDDVPSLIRPQSGGRHALFFADVWPHVRG